MAAVTAAFLLEVLEMCPCQWGRLGAFTLAACICWAWAAGGLAMMLAGLHAGDTIAIGWAVAAFFGGGWLSIGIFEALSHADTFRPQSVLWSVAVIGFAGYALNHGWYFSGDTLLSQLSHAAWFGWIASEVFNIWLNLRGVGPRRRTVSSLLPPIPEPTMPEPRPRLRRRRRVEWVEEIEEDAAAANNFTGRLADADALPGAAVLPQTVYVKDGTGQFIPLHLPGTAPVNYRLSS
jgi:hypothetical protein